MFKRTIFSFGTTDELLLWMSVTSSSLSSLSTDCLQDRRLCSIYPCNPAFVVKIVVSQPAPGDVLLHRCSSLYKSVRF